MMDLMIFLMMMVRHRLFAVLGSGTAEQLRAFCKSNHTWMKSDAEGPPEAAAAANNKWNASKGS